MNKSLEFHVRETTTFGQLTVAAGGSPARTVVINTDRTGNGSVETSAAAQCREAGLSTFIYADPLAVPGRLRPNDMVATLRAAVARLRAEPDVDEDLIGVLAIGPVAGGVALVAAADDPWIRAVCVRDALLDGAHWLREVSGLDEAGWRRMADDAVRRLQGVTVDGRGGDLLRLPEARPPGLPDEIELATFDHLLRLRPRECAARIPAAQLRMTVSAAGPASVDASGARQDAEWLRDSLHFSPYEVTVQT